MFFGSIPGAGFLPFWLSLAMAGLSLLLVVKGLRTRESEDRPVGWPRGRGFLWIGATLFALLAYTFLVSVVGYILSTFAFMLLLVRLLGSYRWLWSAGISAATAVGLYVVFHEWLVMILPTGLLIVP